MKSDGSKRIKNDNVQGYGPTIGSGKPPVSNVPLLPKNMNKPFWQRFKEWWK